MVLQLHSRFGHNNSHPIIIFEITPTVRHWTITWNYTTATTVHSTSKHLNTFVLFYEVWYKLLVSRLMLGIF